MRAWLSSPRRQRRLARIGLALVAVLALVGAIVLLPSRDAPREVLRPGPVPKEEPEVKLSPADRRAINATLAEFVPAALSRDDPDTAWRLSGPGLRAGTKRADWLAGNIPVHPYPLKQQRFDGWRKVYSHRNRVALDLIVRPKPEARVGDIAFAVDLVRSGKRWVVDSMYPAAIWNAPDERPWVAGWADYRAGASTPKSFYQRKIDERRLSVGWLALPAGVLALAFLIPIVLGLRSVVLSRRAAARYQATR